MRQTPRVHDISSWDQIMPLSGVRSVRYRTRKNLNIHELNTGLTRLPFSHFPSVVLSVKRRLPMNRAFTGISLIALVCGVAFGQTAEPQPAFDIADVHASAHVTNPFMRGGVLRGGRLGGRGGRNGLRVGLRWRSLCGHCRCHEHRGNEYGGDLNHRWASGYEGQ